MSLGSDDLPNLPDPGAGWFWEIEDDFGILTLSLGQKISNGYVLEENIMYSTPLENPTWFKSEADELLKRRDLARYVGTYSYKDGKLVKE